MLATFLGTAVQLTSAASNPCQPSSFTFPDITGAELVTISAQTLSNYSRVSILPGTDTAASYSIEACNVTVSYGHTGWNDTINVSIWLPTEGWSNRLLGIGGGGYSGTFGAIYHTAAVAKGFVAVGTDAGHVSGMESSSDPSSWALTAPGNPNYYLIEDFASRSLGELSVIGKHITREFFGQPPRSSYFTGCSGGGRQAFELVQRYPTAFDGVLASSPAINLGTAIAAAYYSAQRMNTNDHYPAPCEVEAATRAAIAACDRLDGVADGIISNPQYCSFSAYDFVNHTFSCNGTQRVFTKESAEIVDAAWTGPNNGQVSYHPYNKDADLTSAIIATQCRDNSLDCTRLATRNVAAGSLSTSGGTADSDLLGSLFQYFLAKDPAFDVESMTLRDYYARLLQASTELGPTLGAADPNLRGFQLAGGKFISWHGLADTILPPAGTSAYYDEVSRFNSDTQNFYRHFEAPGAGHCYGGSGPLPNEALDSLIDWVERDHAPEILLASSTQANISRPLCPYPSRQLYTGGDPSVVGSFACA